MPVPTVFITTMPNPTTAAVKTTQSTVTAPDSSFKKYLNEFRVVILDTLSKRFMELVNGYFGEVSGPTIESFSFLAQGTTTVAQLRQLGCPDVNTQEFLEKLRTQLVYNVRGRMSDRRRYRIEVSRNLSNAATVN